MGRSAGQATNVVTDYVKVQGESRSHDAKFITRSPRRIARRSHTLPTPSSMTRGRRANVKFKTHRSYFPYELKKNSSVVQTAQSVAATSAGRRR